MLENIGSFIGNPEFWHGPDSVFARLGEHLSYSALAVLVASLLSVPIGLYIGHTGRGHNLLVGVANSLRALPSLGVMTLLVLLLGIGIVPPIIALVLIGAPPILAGTYAGVNAVDRSTVAAARSMGMTESRLVFTVEVPNALPLILAGLRSATLQIVATATIAAYVNLGGFGRFIFDGLALFKYDEVIVGAVLVTLLALTLDGLCVILIRLSRPGTGRARWRDRSLREEISYRNTSSQRNRIPHD